MRRSSFVLIACLLFSQQIEIVENRTMSWGNLQPKNLLMFDQFFYDQYNDQNLNFQSVHGYLISAIHVTDLTFHQDGGRVEILAGGIGFNYVKLKLKREVDRNLLLNIEIFGQCWS